ncbi:type VI secretion system-associated protein TagO [Sulfitobacter mediterraneus]|nr:type VI secretion system-associated protein TagO [Sulfitobacter mediterraneus]
MFRFLPLTTILVFAAGQAFANEQDPTECHSFTGENTRLVCYDRVTGYNGESAGETKEETSAQVQTSTIPSPHGNQWRLATEKSALDDRQDVWLSVPSQNTEGNAIGSPIRAFFYVRCMENRTNTFISFDRYTTDNQNVRYKLDEGSVKKHWMQAMRGGEGIGVWSGGKAIPFVKQLLGKKKLVVGYDTFSGPVEFVFNISGLEKQLHLLAEECDWSF